MIVGALAALFLAPLFIAGSVALVAVGLLAGCAILAVVVCRRHRHRGLMYPVVVVVPVVLVPQDVLWPSRELMPPATP